MALVPDCGRQVVWSVAKPDSFNEAMRRVNKRQAASTPWRDLICNQKGCNNGEDVIIGNFFIAKFSCIGR